MPQKNEVASGQLWVLVLASPIRIGTSRITQWPVATGTGTVFRHRSSVMGRCLHIGGRPLVWGMMAGIASAAAGGSVMHGRRRYRTGHE